jgi:NADH-quinone oxidoreductase subunit F
MDLKLSSHTPTDAEIAAIDGILGATEAYDDRLNRAGHDLREQRHRLLPVLHAVNDRVGWISRGAINHIAARMDVAPAEIYGVATFYGLFSTEERPSRQVHVCIDLACQIAGATVPEGAHESPCLGLCERAPAVFVVDAGEQPQQGVLAPATPVQVRDLVAGAALPPEPAPDAATPQVHADRDHLVLLKRAGVVDPTSLHDYRSHEGYLALRRAIEMGPDAVVREMLDSKIMGRGGAAFPAGRKWDTVAHHAVRPHYVVCNADESEPGTFKDRAIMEGDPFSLIEAMTIAAFATGSEQGYIYLRGEYPRAKQLLRNAIAVATEHHLLGDNIMGAGFSFHLEVFVGAGAYICGEETAIFNSIEGFRGEPRNKPPFPVDAGLFAKPTLVNNVETLANVLPIVLHGGEAFSHTGTAGSTGSKLFCVSGSVTTPGVYELPFGTTLRQVIDAAGGVANGHELKAVLLGGAAGSFATPADLDIPLTFEDLRANQLSLGSGVVMVLDEHVDLVQFVHRIAAFFRDESCGQCVPCRVGTMRQEEVLQRLEHHGPGFDDDRQLLTDIGRVLRDASICGFGHSAHGAIESAIAKLGVFS